MPANKETGRKSGVVAPFRRRGRTGPDGPARPSPAELAAIMARIDRRSDVDAARLVRLRDLIAAGEYEVDARRTAEGLIRLESALDLKGKG